MNDKVLDLSSDSTKISDHLKEFSKQKTLKDVLEQAKLNGVSLLNNFAKPTPVLLFSKPMINKLKLNKPKRIITKRIREIIIRKSSRIIKKSYPNTLAVNGSIYESNLRRSPRLSIKKNSNEFVIEKKKRKLLKFKTEKILKEDEVKDEMMIDIDCSRRLAKKAIARNKLNS